MTINLDEIDPDNLDPNDPRIGDIAWAMHLRLEDESNAIFDRANEVFKNYIYLLNAAEITEDEYKNGESRLGESIKTKLDSESIWDFVDLIIENYGTLVASARAKRRHAISPKQAVKQQVRECWDDWNNGLRSYKSKSAFARDMLDKFPTQKDEKGRQTGLENQRVIERWCKKWESETSQQSTYPAS